MAIDSDLRLTGRTIRTQWRETEEDFIEQSSHYAKRQLSLLDFLSNVAHSGNAVRIKTNAHVVAGMICVIGTDFFSVIPDLDRNKRYVFPVHDQDTKNSRLDCEMTVLKKRPSKKSSNLQLRQEKSFRYMLDETTLTNKDVEIETANGSTYTGKCELFLDCVTLAGKDVLHSTHTLVSEGTMIIPMGSITSICTKA